MKIGAHLEVQEDIKLGRSIVDGSEYDVQEAQSSPLSDKIHSQKAQSSRRFYWPPFHKGGDYPQQTTFPEQYADNKKKKYERNGYWRESSSHWRGYTQEPYVSSDDEACRGCAPPPSSPDSQGMWQGWVPQFFIPMFPPPPLMWMWSSFLPPWGYIQPPSMWLPNYGGMQWTSSCW